MIFLKNTICLAVCLAGVVLADYIELNAVHDGNLYAATNWIGDVLPTGENSLTGRVSTAAMPAGGTFWTPGPVYDFALLQEGGLYVRAGDLNLRGGVTNETVTVPGRTEWVINDTTQNPSAYTNLYVATNLVIWSHMGGAIDLTLLNGRIEAGGALRMASTDKGVLCISNGVFQAQGFRAQSGTIRMAKGGTAAVSLGRFEDSLRNVVFDFESGNRGSVTIEQAETEAPFSTKDWQVLADSGKLTVDGVPSGLEYFVLSNSGRTLQHIGALPGLTVVSGKLYKEGAVYRGIGVNYCDLFHAMINFPEYAGQTEYRTLEGLRFLGEQGVPFVRFWACGFWPVDWDLYFADKEEWFRRMDLLVQTAEEAGVGLIPSLFWRDQTIPNLVEEYQDQWANPNSRVRQFMTNYVAEVVGRYKDSPAIWGWEFSNELNLRCDLPNWETSLGKEIPHVGVGGISMEVNERNRMTYAIAEEMLTAFAVEVRKLDAHRFITTGHSRPRAAAWHNRVETNWVVDTYAQAFEAFQWMSPTSSIDMASFHVYPYSMSQTGAVPVYAEASGVADILLRYREFCNVQKQVMFVGEYSSFYDGQGVAPEDERAEEIALLQAIVDSGADLAAYWVFDRGINRAEVGTIYPSTGAYTGVLDLILEYDAKMRSERWRTARGAPPEWFERFGIVPTSWQTWAEIEAQDLNGNGMPLWQEYITGIHPVDPVLPFAITALQVIPDGQVRLEWNGGTNGLTSPYVVQSKLSLPEEGWRDAAQVKRTQGINHWTGNAPVENRGFFRILAGEPQSE